MVVWEVVKCVVIFVVVVVVFFLEILTSVTHMISILFLAKCVITVWGLVRTWPEALMLR